MAAKGRASVWSEAFNVFAVCSFPVFVWAIVNILLDTSQWLLRMSSAEVLGVIAYMLGFAFLESLVIFLVVMVILRLLPARVRARVSNAHILITVSLTMALLIFLNMSEKQLLLKGTPIETYGGLVGYVVLLALSFFLLRRSPRVARLANAFVERVAPLAFFYAIFGLLGAAMVIIRNVF